MKDCSWTVTASRRGVVHHEVAVVDLDEVRKPASLAPTGPAHTRAGKTAARASPLPRARGRDYFFTFGFFSVTSVRRVGSL